MTFNGLLAKKIVNILGAESQFNDLVFVVAYENEIKPTPLTDPIVAISIKHCEIGDKVSTTLENGQLVKLNSRNMSTTLSADIYLPYSKGGSEGHKIFDRIATYLLFSSTYTISKAVCYNTDYDNSCQAIILRTHFVFENLIAG